MSNLVVFLLCLSITIVAVLLTSGIKQLVKFCYTKRGKEFNIKTWEYAFIGIPMVVTFGGVFLLLWEVYGVAYQCSLALPNGLLLELESYEALATTSSKYAAITQTVYVILQAIRKLSKKGWSGVLTIFHSITKALTNAKAKKTLVESPKEFVEELQEGLNNEQNTLQKVKEMYEVLVRNPKV